MMDVHYYGESNRGMVKKPKRRKNGRRCCVRISLQVAEKSTVFVLRFSVVRTHPALGPAECLVGSQIDIVTIVTKMNCLLG